MRTKKLIDTTPDWTTKGIFYHLNLLAVPWQEKGISNDLDFDYYGNNSGDKPISPLVEKLLDDNGELSTTSLTKLASIIFNKFGLQWSKLWDTLELEYNPIENYSMVETHEGTDTNTFTPTDWSEVTTQKPTDWKTVSEGEKNDNSSDSQTSFYGFGSSDPSPVQSVETSVKNKQTTETSGEYETEVTKSGTEQTTIDHDTTLTRKGNIGVTTSQQMIESERKLWEYNIFNQIYKDVDSILTLSIY